MYNNFHHGNEQLKNLEAITGLYRSKHMQASEGHVTLFSPEPRHYGLSTVEATSHFPVDKIKQ